MTRNILLIALLLSMVIVLATFAETTWVLWSAAETRVFHSEKGRHAAWAYVDAFTSKEACTDEKTMLHEEGFRYQCVPVEINPNNIIFR